MVQPDFGPIIYSYRPRRARREIGLTSAKHARTRFKEVRKEEEPAGRIGEREREIAQAGDRINTEPVKTRSICGRSQLACVFVCVCCGPKQVLCLCFEHLQNVLTAVAVWCGTLTG